MKNKSGSVLRDINKAGLVIALTGVILAALVGCGKAVNAVNASSNKMSGDITLGVWNEGRDVLINEWSGIKFTVPDGLYAVSDETLAATMNGGKEAFADAMDMSGDTVDASYARVKFELFAQAADGIPSVSLAYEKVNLFAMTEKAYFAQLDKQLAALGSAYGIEYAKVGGITKVDAAGMEMSKLTYSLGGAAYQDYYLRNVNGVMVEIIVTYADADDAAKLIGGVEAY